MSVTTLTSKGQMTLPKEIRDDLNLRAGDKVEFVKVGGRYELRPHNIRIESLAGILKRDGQPSLAVEDMDEALGTALAEDERRIRAGR